MSAFNPSQPVTAPKITIFPQTDASGHIISATGTGTDGSKVGVEFPPFPNQNSITFTKAGTPNLVITSTIAENTCTLSAVVGSKELTLAFTSNGPSSVPHYEMVGGGAFPDATSLAASLQKACEQFFVQNFDDHFDFDFHQFLDICEEAGLQRSPNGVNPILTSVLQGTVPAGAADKSVKGTVGRAIVWGVAGAAVAFLSGGTSLVIWGAFVWGADASIFSDIITAVDTSSDDSGGGGKAAPTPGGNDSQGQLKDLPVNPPTK